MKLFGKGDKATASTRFSASLSPTTILALVLRFVQMIMGIVVIGLYAQDLVRAKSAGVGHDSKWLYATVVGTISTIIAIIFMTPIGVRQFWFALEWIIFILYVAAFGVFGKLYIGENPEGNGGITRMKNAVWCLLVNMILWFISSLWSTWIFFRWFKGRTTMTGRAQQHIV